ncbi:MAG: hypothetical protein COY80_01210 [Candidatus Pacebacteria bacterium CG_4_10_14_0_8_um_filter_42_14]|nr:MAG: hypothetical protein COY80_01210 [Candidatus Pacebacteria bacterium CG_4_10_14_0_8_um_filter_42_14]
MQVANSPEALQDHHLSWRSLLFSYGHLIHVLWKKTAMVFLTIYGLYGLFSALHLLLAKYPELERMLAVQEIQQVEVEKVVAEMLVVLLVTVIDTAIALRLSKAKDLKSEIIDVLLATVFLIFNGALINYVLSYDIFGIISRFTSR